MFSQSRRTLREKLVGFISGGRERPDMLHVADPRFDGWEIVGEYQDLETARAWWQRLDELGIGGVITTDWPLDRFGRGDIVLRVLPQDWSQATEIIDNIELQ